MKFQAVTLSEGTWRRAVGTSVLVYTGTCATVAIYTERKRATASESIGLIHCKRRHVSYTAVDHIVGYTVSYTVAEGIVGNLPV